MITFDRLRERLHYAPETGLFTWLKCAGPHGRVNAGYPAGTRYKKKIAIGIDGANYAAHLLAWLYMTGSWPDQQIDHIDGNPHNNQWANLRDVASRINQENRRRPHRNNISGALGVSRDRGRWQARIVVSGVRRNVGSFKTVEEAAAAYLEAKRKLHTGCTI